MGTNNPMEVENFSDKMEFQGRGAAHIHGVAWCNLQKVSQVLNSECRNTDTKDNFESDSDCDFEDDLENDSDIELEQDADTDFESKSGLEKAFEKLRLDEKLKKKERKALVAFADRFVTCTLNPDMAAKMIDETVSIEEGIKIVKKVKETQTHHHTKTCKKKSPNCRFGIPRFPIWESMLTKPVEGESEEEKSDRRIIHKHVLKAVLDVLEDENEMGKIWKDYDKLSETQEEYKLNRKQRILRVLEIAGVSAKSYVAAVREQAKRGISVILARDVDEMYINNYNPEWIRAWDGNIDIQPCLDFFGLITYVTEYFTKDKVEHQPCLKQQPRSVQSLG